VLQKDGFFRKRDEKRDDSFFRPATPVTTTPAPAANVAVAPVTEPKADARREAKLVVGPEIKIKGVEISDCDTLVVEGRIEATLDSRVLEITEHGVFQGTIAVDNAEIHGRFEGELTVRKQLVIHATGKVLGQDPLHQDQGRGRRGARPARSPCWTRPRRASRSAARPPDRRIA
jgi:hypothetical protein